MSPPELYTLSLHDALPICSLGDQVGAGRHSDRVRPGGVIAGNDRRTQAHRVIRLVDDPASDEIEVRSEEHTSELQSRVDLVCRLLLEKKNQNLRAGIQRQN